jgi:hypothetical protein
MLTNWSDSFSYFGQKGTVVEKATEETLKDWDHLKELLSVCEGKALYKVLLLLLGGVVHLLILWYYNSSKTDRGDLLE